MHLIHRGLVNKKLEENLLISFQKSFNRGFGIETDIHATKDREFVCFHDFTLKRTFNISKSVKNVNYQKLKEISKNKKAEIPLLKDLLKLSKNKFFLFIEIKPLFSKALLKKLLNETKNYSKCVKWYFNNAQYKSALESIDSLSQSVRLQSVFITPTLDR